MKTEIQEGMDVTGTWVLCLDVVKNWQSGRHTKGGVSIRCFVFWVIILERLDLNCWLNPTIDIKLTAWLHVLIDSRESKSPHFVYFEIFL